MGNPILLSNPTTADPIIHHNKWLYSIVKVVAPLYTLGLPAYTARDPRHVPVTPKSHAGVSKIATGAVQEGDNWGRGGSRVSRGHFKGGKR